MSKRDPVHQIRQFGNRFNRFRKSSRGNSYRNMTKRTKAALKSNSRKKNVFNEQMRYAFHSVLQDLTSSPLATCLTVMVIAIFLTLLSICYMTYKNINQAVSQHCPSPQIIVYLDKTLDDNAAVQVIEQIQAEQEVEKVNYLSRKEALNEFQNWSGFGGVLDMLEENALPAVAVVILKWDFQGPDSFNTLCDRIKRINGIDEVRVDNNWLSRLAPLSGLVGEISAVIGALMTLLVFLVIGNSVRLSIFAHRDVINVQKLIGATDSFILRPFLYDGTLFGFFGASLSLIVSEILLMRFSLVVNEVTDVFGTSFNINGLSFDERLLLLLLYSMIGWIAAWLATVQHLRHITPN